jgi:TfoX/Sxy family transcriptional regulator of competence genes
MKTAAAKKSATVRGATRSSKPGSRIDLVSGSPKTSPEIDPAFQSVASAFAQDSQVGLGKMFSSKSVLNVNGKIFAMFVRGRFVAKLPKDRVDALVRSGTGDYFDPGHGRLMKEWVALTDSSTQWVPLAKEAYAFVKAVKR